MELVKFALSFFAASIVIGILIGYSLRWLGQNYLDRTVAFHTRNLDTELNDLLHKRKDS